MNFRRFNKAARVVVALLMACFVVSAAHAERLVYEHAGAPLFSIEVPDGWLVDLDFAQEAREAGTYVEGEELELRVVEIRPDDGREIWFGIWSIPDVANLEEGEEYLRTLRGDLFTGAKVSSPTEAKLGGMPGRRISGTATYQGETVEVALALFQALDDVVVAVVYVGAPDAWDVHEDELRSMLASVRPSD